jgi:hypothetical protein
LIKEDISLKYKILKSDGRYFVISKDTGEIMPEVQGAFNSAVEAIDTAAEEVFVSRMVKLLYGKRTFKGNPKDIGIASAKRSQ